MAVVRVLVVDDHESFRRTAVAGSAATGEEAVTAARTVAPDLVLMDVHLPRMDGLDATRRLRSLDRPPVVVLLSTYDEDDFGGRARECGAVGYIAKSSFGTERLASVWALAARG